MPSPFPGMDPYLEAHWGDVHTRLITYSSDQLRPRLPTDLRPRVEERVYVETDDDSDRRSIYPDIRVIERPFGGNGGYMPSPNGGAAVAVAEPIIIELVHEPKTERYIEIRDIGSGGRVITVIEFVSPSNKVPGEGRNLYLKKQRELDEARVNSVAIDLVRTGDHVVAAASELLPPAFQTAYRACVRRAAQPSKVEAYRVPLREPLPTINIPLRENDADVRLNLQALIEQCYENAGYDDIDYSRPPLPRLQGDDARWAEELLRERALHGAS